MKNLSVQIKILLLATIMLIITCIVAGVGIYTNARSRQAVDDMYHYNLMTAQYLNDATTQLRGMESNTDYLLQQDFTPENQKLLLDDIAKRAAAIQDDADKIRSIDSSDRAQKALDTLSSQLTQLSADAKGAANLTNSPADKARLMQSLSGVKAVSATLGDLTPDNIAQGKTQFELTSAAYDRTIKIFVGIIILGLIIGLVSATLIARGIARPLGHSVNMLHAVADGDLTQALPPELAKRRDEVGEMITALEKMQQSLRTFLKQVHDEAESSVAMVHEVQELVGSLNDGAQDMSAATEEMSAGMEETASSTANLQHLADQIGEGIQHNADEAKDSEAYTNEVAERAGKLKQDMEHSSQKAHDIYYETKDSVE